MNNATAVSLLAQIERRRSPQRGPRPPVPRPRRVAQTPERVRPPRPRTGARPGPSDRRQASDRRAGRSAGRGCRSRSRTCSASRASRRPAAAGCSRTFRPPYDATVITKLKEADAILFGKTNMDEFAMGSSTENSAYGPTLNPWDEERIPGGSSGGSAAAVAADLAPVSLGTRHRGLDPPAGRRLRDRRAQADVRPGQPLRPDRLRQLARPDRPVRSRPGRRGAALEGDLGPRPARRDQRRPGGSRLHRNARQGRPSSLRIGVAREYFGEGLDPEVEAAVREAIQVYEKAGATIEEVSLPTLEVRRPGLLHRGPGRVFEQPARYDGTIFGHRAEDWSPEYPGEEDIHPLVRMMMASRAEGFGPEVKRRIMLGTFALSAGYADQYYNQALKVRRLIRNDFDEAFKKVDVILGPTSPTAGLQARRADRRPAGDVPLGHLHDHRQPRRHPGRQPALRLHRSRTCRSASSFWPRPSPRRTCSAPPASSSARPTGTRGGRGCHEAERFC